MWERAYQRSRDRLDEVGEISLDRLASGLGEYRLLFRLSCGDMGGELEAAS